MGTTSQLEERRRDAEVRETWNKSDFAHEIAVHLVKHRADNNLTQAALARNVGLKQPAIARLELGDQAPSLATLAKLSATTGLEFHVEISQGTVALAG